MTKIELAKAVTGFVAGFGSSAIVAGIVNNNVPQQTVIEKVTVMTGRVAIGMMVSDAVRKTTDSKIDAVATWWAQNVTK